MTCLLLFGEQTSGITECVVAGDELLRYTRDSDKGHNSNASDLMNAGEAAALFGCHVLVAVGNWATASGVG
jgi:hypothetical protein